MHQRPGAHHAFPVGGVVADHRSGGTGNYSQLTPPSSPVPPPTPTAGTTSPPDSTVVYASPVPVGETSTVESVDVKVTDIKATIAEGRLPGEVNGPAIQVTIEVTNGTSKPLSVDGVNVNTADSAKVPGGEILGPPTRTFRGSIKPGSSATGVYVFTMPVDRRSAVRIEVMVPDVGPRIIFEGKAP